MAGKEESKYFELFENALVEFKKIQKELRREQVKSERLRAASRQTMKETWEILRRVEKTL